MLSVRVVELLDLEGLLLSSSNYNLFSKFKAFGDFSESLFTWKPILWSLLKERDRQRQLLFQADCGRYYGYGGIGDISAGELAE